MRILVALVIALAACGGVARPPHTFDVPARPEQLLDDDAGFARFAAAVRVDLEAEDAAGGGTRAARKDRWFDLALLDGLAGDWAGANARLDQIVADDPPSYMVGLTIRAWADAGGTDPEAFRRALAARIAAMPHAAVAEELALLQQLAVALTPTTSRALIAEHVGPAARRGPIGRELASAILFQRWSMRRIAPVGPIIDEVVGAAAP